MDCVLLPEGSVKLTVVFLSEDICFSIWVNMGSSSSLTALFLSLPNASPVDGCSCMPTNSYLYLPFVLSHATHGHEATLVWNAASAKEKFCGLIWKVSR